MVAIISNSNKNIDQIYKNCITSGNIFVQDYSEDLEGIIDYTKNLIAKYFKTDVGAQTLQESLELEEFVDLASGLKTEFTDSQSTHKLFQSFLKKINLNEDIYFDKPRLRIVTYNKYLETGVGYAYKPHRDSWYAGPISQLNFWLPVFDVDENSSLAFFPSFWDKPIKNQSKNFDYSYWQNNFRKIAKNQIGSENRSHPLPEENIDYSNEIRIACNSGQAIVFAGTHLHATVPNTSSKTRFSIDFRIIKKDYFNNNFGKNVDTESTGSTVTDFLNINSLENFKI